MSDIKFSCVDGLFYPKEKLTLENIISNFLKNLIQENHTNNKNLRAIIVPHAGYVYSGQVAAYAYQMLLPIKNHINNIILIGPAHYLSFNGIATIDKKRYKTPLGEININQDIVRSLINYPNSNVKIIEKAFEKEHSLEVQIPFIQYINNKINIVPLLIGGKTDSYEVAKILNLLWKNSNNNNDIFIISSDLSHYHDYETANKIDSRTSNYILNLDYNSIEPHMACGAIGIKSILEVAKNNNAHINLLNLCNSGDSFGNKERVVGYGSYFINS